MPKVDIHSSILIATSWQALGRALQGRPDTLLCNCTVVILFAGFYVEAILNFIVESIGMKPQMESFLKKPYPGLQDKLAWFYNEFVARTKASNRTDLYNKHDIRKKIRRRFPGFDKLYKFRNDISHGIINNSARCVNETKQLRQQAKNMVGEFYSIMQKHGYDIPRENNYYQMIKS